MDETLKNEIAACEHYGYQFIEHSDCYILKYANKRTIAKLYNHSRELAYDVMVDMAVIDYRRQRESA